MEENTIKSRADINEEFKLTLENENFSEVLEKVSNLKTQYDESHRDFYQKKLNEFLETKIKLEDSEEEIIPKESDFKFQADEASHRFKELYTIFLEKKKEYKKALAQKEEDNFKAKSEVISQMKELTEAAFDNFGSKFNQFNKLQNEWKSIGDVNKARFQTLQTEYSHLIDKFFYNVNIHKGLQNYSFEKNKVQKEKIISKLKELINNDSIIQLEFYIKKYQKEWDEIGPTFQENWDVLKDEYWNGVNAIYGKIREHYLKIREKQKEVILKKEKLIEDLKVKLEEINQSDNPKKWNDIITTVKEMQLSWKKTGFSKKNKDDALWEEFKGITNQIFDFTKERYNQLNEKRSVFEVQKKELIAKARAMQDSTNWRETTEKYKKLQEKWKNTGHLNHQKDQKLWNTFRSACNKFFETKKEFFNTLDDRQEANLTTKKECVEAILKCKNTEEFELKIKEWWAIGHVPKKSIGSVNSEFTKATDKVAKALKIDDLAKESIIFNAKIASYKANDNSDSLIKNEKRYIKEKMETIKNEIHQYENNLSFFGHSKGAQKLKEVVEKKITSAKEDLMIWNNKMKILQH